MADFRNIYPHVDEVNALYPKHNKVIIFDTETTGLEVDAKVIQFSGVLYEKDGDSLKEIDNIDIFINPEEKLDPKITKITGITDDDLKYAMKEKDAFERISEFMSKADLYAAYNAPFDLEKLKYMARRCDKPELNLKTIDVLVMAKNMLLDIKNHKLQTVTEELVPNYKTDYHNALSDVRATGRCLEELVKMYQKVEKPDLDNRIKKAVSYAYFFANPRNQGQRRIKIYIDKKDSGIFWDCKRGCFSHLQKKEAKENFAKFDIVEIEKQLLFRYGKKLSATTMDELSRNWQRASAKKEKEVVEKVEKTENNELDIEIS